MPNDEIPGARGPGELSSELDLVLTALGKKSPDGSAETTILKAAKQCGWPVEVPVVAGGLTGCLSDWIKAGKFPSDEDAGAEFLRHCVLPGDYAEDVTKLLPLHEGRPPGIFAADLGCEGLSQEQVAARRSCPVVPGSPEPGTCADHARR